MSWFRPRPAPVEVERFELVKCWERATEGAGFVRVIPTVTGPTVVPPKITRVERRDDTLVLTVRLEPGQTVDDLRTAAPRIAPHLGAFGLRVEPLGQGAWCRVTLLPCDPLAGPPPAPAAGTGWVTVLGRGEDGAAVLLDWSSAAHLVVQGATRSGKSTGLYGLLSQLADAEHVEVTGCDPTGLLLAPWVARTAAVAPSTGTGNPAAHVATLEALTGVMDDRIGAIPPGRDTVELGPDYPLMIVVLEEYPGLLRILDADRQVGKRARAAVARLLGEGAKAGLRLVLIAQRAEANLLGGFERDQASHALSYRVGGRESVRLLHPDAGPDVIAGHATALPGTALLSAPGVPLRRLRTPHVTYPDYCQAVAGRSAA